MNPLRRVFNRNRNRNMNRQSPPPPPAQQADPTNPPASPTQSWTTHDSNLALLSCLSTATPTRPALPNELILQILDHPSRWVQLHNTSHPPSADRNNYVLRVGDNPTGVPVLYTRPFTAHEAGRTRKIVFAFRSRDQGWASLPAESGGTWSWFDASLAQLPGADEDGRGEFADAAVWTGGYD